MAGDSVFPTVPSTSVWPERRSSRRTKVIGATLAAIPAVGAVLWVIAVLGAEPKTFANVLGAIGGALLALGAAFLIVSVAGLLRGRDVAARAQVDPVRGAGVELTMRRTDLPILMLLAGCALYGFAAWLGWRAGQGSALLPLSKDNSTGATFALIFGLGSALVLVLLAVVLRWKVSVTLYPTGILRRVPLPWQAVKEQLVAWDDIESIMPSQVRPSAQSGSMPLIALSIGDTPIVAPHKLFDESGAFGIPVYLMTCEPNTALAVLRFLHSHPESRQLLARRDAADWFATAGADR